MRRFATPTASKWRDGTSTSSEATPFLRPSTTVRLRPRILLRPPRHNNVSKLSLFFP